MRRVSSTPSRAQTFLCYQDRYVSLKGRTLESGFGSLSLRLSTTEPQCIFLHPITAQQAASPHSAHSHLPNSCTSDWIGLYSSNPNRPIPQYQITTRVGSPVTLMVKLKQLPHPKAKWGHCPPNSDDHYTTHLGPSLTRTVHVTEQFR